MFLRCAVLVLGGLSLSARPVAAAPYESNGEPPTATFSIVGCDTATGEWGVAVSSKFLAVGSVVPWARAGGGAVATQAFANTSFGPDGLDLLERGKSAAAVLDRLVGGDPGADARQVGIVDRGGNGATFTGKGCLPWAGGLMGPGCVAQGNTLAGEDVVSSMVRSFGSTVGRPLAERLLEALQAGENAGGDRRGKQSAALLVVREDGGYGGFNDRYVDLRVDDSRDPLAELMRLYQLHAHTFLPAVHSRLGDAAQGRGDKLLAEREYSRVIQLYHEAIEADPNAPEPRNGLAWFYVEHRMNLNEALALAEEANRLAPEDWQVLDTLAEIYFNRGDLDKASVTASRAAQAHPENGYLQQQAARFRQAIAHREGL